MVRRSEIGKSYAAFIEDRRRKEKRYEGMGYEARRAGDEVEAQRCFQMAENYKITKDAEQ